ncbi:MAG TPA: hypothetical protein DCX89_00730 [Saprospirales bacterium]|nr:hypothetical protein [Saprospirales bacterium]HAY70389.1 hypothetical protein [Saprospirales bacterium]HRQ29627.1 T9SS type A sorting domain-containing protein [Saprospiraceae bacterium]
MKFIILLSLIFYFIPGTAQEWAPVGAKWHYDILYAFSGDVGYHEVYCDSIVEIAGKSCKRINIDYAACNNYFTQKLYTYSQGDSLMVYDPQLDIFQMLYNFGAEPGDKWNYLIVEFFEGSIDTLQIQVDSIGLEYINGTALKKQYISYTYPEEYQLYTHGIVMEKLGDIVFLANINTSFYGLCDVDFIGFLRCYEDAEIGFYSTELRDSCTWSFKWGSSFKTIYEESIRIFPNPVDKNLYFSTTDITCKYQIFNGLGQIMMTGEGRSTDVSGLAEGLYIIVLDNGIEKATTLFVKLGQ